MPQLDEDAAIGLAGGDVQDLAEAEHVEKVSAADVAAAEKAADAAEYKAQQSETSAVLGNLGAGTAAADREAARYARLRAHVTRRRAERHQQAERLKALAQCGSDAVSHAAKLTALRTATLADLAAIASLHARIRDRVSEWNDGLQEIADRGAALSPEPLLPGGHPQASSAHVWAGTVDTRGKVVAGNHVITGIWAEHPDGLPAAIDAASKQTAGHDPAVRLIAGENGVVVPMGRDEYGHMQQRIDRGEVHELTLAEKLAYYAGER